MSLLVLTSLAHDFSRTKYLQAYHTISKLKGGGINHTVLVSAQCESLHICYLLKITELLAAIHINIISTCFLQLFILIILILLKNNLTIIKSHNQGEIRLTTQSQFIAKSLSTQDDRALSATQSLKLSFSCFLQLLISIILISLMKKCNKTLSNARSFCLLLLFPVLLLCLWLFYRLLVNPPPFFKVLKCHGGGSLEMLQKVSHLPVKQCHTQFTRQVVLF